MNLSVFLHLLILVKFLRKKGLTSYLITSLSYNEGLNLLRGFLEFASHQTVEELQAFTAQWLPHPP